MIRVYCVVEVAQWDNYSDEQHGVYLNKEKALEKALRIAFVRENEDEKTIFKSLIKTYAYTYLSFLPYSSIVIKTQVLRSGVLSPRKIVHGTYEDGNGNKRHIYGLSISDLEKKSDGQKIRKKWLSVS